MATQSLSFGTKTAITWTPASLAAAANDFSQAVTGNTSPEVQVFITFATGTTPAAGGTVSLYAYGSNGDASPTYSGGLSGADGATVTGETSALKLIDTITVDATSNHVYECGPYNLTDAFKGPVPPDWGVGCVNGTSATFNGTGGNFTATYRTVTNVIA